MSIRTRPAAASTEPTRRWPHLAAGKLSGGAGSPEPDSRASSAKRAHPLVTARSASAPSLTAAATTGGSGSVSCPAHPPPPRALRARPGVCLAAVGRRAERRPLLWGVGILGAPTQYSSVATPLQCKPPRPQPAFVGASMAEEAQYAFDVSWFDPIASMTRKYQLIHYASTEPSRWCSSALRHRPLAAAPAPFSQRLHLRGFPAPHPRSPPTRSSRQLPLRHPRTTLQTAAPSSSGATPDGDTQGRISVGHHGVLAAAKSSGTPTRRRRLLCEGDGRDGRRYKLSESGKIIDHPRKASSAELRLRRRAWPSS